MIQCQTYFDDGKVGRGTFAFVAIPRVGDEINLGKAGLWVVEYVQWVMASHDRMEPRLILAPVT